MATVKMVEDLLLVRQLFTGRYDRLWKELEMHRVAEQADARGVERDGCRMSQGRIDEAYNWLIRNNTEQKMRKWA